MWEKFPNGGGGSDPNPLLDVYNTKLFLAYQNDSEVLNMFYKKGGGDQF